MKRLRTVPIPDRRALAGAAAILWVALSPWVWGFAGSHAAVANHVFLVFSFGPMVLLIGNLRAAAFVTLLGGTWLAASPWILGYATNHLAWLSELVTGVLLMILSASAAHIPGDRWRRRARRRAARPAAAGTAASTTTHG